MKTKNQIAALLAGSLFGLELFAAQVGRAQDVRISTGYNDEPRNGTPYSVGSGQPDPWYGSANTTFYGNAGLAQAYDPDEGAILLQNLGGTALTLTAANIGIFNLFTLDSISGPVNLAAGQNVILASVDGSESLSGLQTIGLTIEGINYSFSDVATSDAPDGVLFGANPWIGGSESIPWTTIYEPRNGVPDSGSSLALIGTALTGLCAFGRRFRK